MNTAKKFSGDFTRTEYGIWISSVSVIVISFLLFDRNGFLTLCASLIGATSLIFNAKGNPFGQLLMVIFSVLYGIISYSFAYYGEMITYLGMTAPMSLLALFSWLRNPYNDNKKEVRVNRVKRSELIFMILLSIAVTAIFFFILKAFNTANLIPSTISVTTSFASVYLTFRRSPLFALGYALNDAVLIFLWICASLTNSSYISVVICFTIFLFNDLYGFISWRKIEKKQNLYKKD